jgi:hypothetical protein
MANASRRKAEQSQGVFATTAFAGKLNRFDAVCQMTKILSFNGEAPGM